MPRKASACIKLVDTMEAMLQKKPIGDIKIVELCEIAGVSRRTFYDNFCDVFDVAPWLWDQLMFSSLYLVGEKFGWHDAHRKMFEFLLSRREFFQRVFKERDYNSVLEHGYRKARDTDVATLEAKFNRPLTEDEYLELDYLTRALSSMTAKWAVEGMLIPPKRMTDIFQRSIPDWLIEAFGE